MREVAQKLEGPKTRVTYHAIATDRPRLAPLPTLFPCIASQTVIVSPNALGRHTPRPPAATKMEPDSAPAAPASVPSPAGAKRRPGRPPAHSGCQVCGKDLSDLRLFHQVSLPSSPSAPVGSPGGSGRRPAIQLPACSDSTSPLGADPYRQQLAPPRWQHRPASASLGAPCTPRTPKQAAVGAWYCSCACVLRRQMASASAPTVCRLPACCPAPLCSATTFVWST